MTALWEKAWAFKDHGKSYDAVYHREHPPGFRWLHESFGTNWRMTEMQAAIGRRQLKKLPDWVAARRRNAAILTEAFSGMAGLRVTAPPENVRHAYYKYYVFVRPERLKAGWDRDRIMNAVAAEGAPCFSGSCSEVYLEKAFDGNGLRPAGAAAGGQGTGRDEPDVPGSSHVDGKGYGDRGRGCPKGYGRGRAFMKNLIRSRNFYVMVLCDTGLVLTAYYLSFYLRFDGQIPEEYLVLFKKTAPVVVVTKIFFFFVFNAVPGNVAIHRHKRPEECRCGHSCSRP